MEKKYILVQVTLKRSKNGSDYFLQPDVINHTEDKIIERIYRPHRLRTMKHRLMKIEETRDDQR